MDRYWQRVLVAEPHRTDTDPTRVARLTLLARSAAPSDRSKSRVFDRRSRRSADPPSAAFSADHGTSAHQRARRRRDSYSGGPPKRQHRANTLRSRSTHSNGHWCRIGVGGTHRCSRPHSLFALLGVASTRCRYHPVRSTITRLAQRCRSTPVDGRGDRHGGDDSPVD